MPSSPEGPWTIWVCPGCGSAEDGVHYRRPNGACRTVADLREERTPVEVIPSSAVSELVGACGRAITKLRDDPRNQEPLAVADYLEAALAHFHSQEQG